MCKDCFNKTARERRQLRGIVKNNDIEYYKNKFKGKGNDKEFSLDIRVSKILKVEDHPDAERLYIMQVDLGSEKRQLVAGLKEIYSKEELMNRQIIVVCNLEPKELKGVKSEGMLLASEDGTILSPEKNVKNGSKVM